VVLAEDGPLRADLEAAGAEVHVRPLAVLRRSLMSPRGMGRVAAAWAADAGGLGRLARKRGIALVHTNTSVTLGGAAAARIAGVPHVWHVREIYAGFERFWPAYRRLLRSADALPCVSHATRAQLGDAPQAAVLHDGLAVVPDPERRAAARAALDLPADAFVVGSFQKDGVGWEEGLEPKLIKGPDVLVAALARVAPEADDLHVLLTGPARGYVRRELDRLGVPHRHVYAKDRDELARAYQALDVYVVASRQEGGPKGVLEAMASGVPLVTTRVGQAQEIAVDGENALVVDVDDADALAGALVDPKLRRLHELRHTLAVLEAARRHLLSDHTKVTHAAD